MFWIERWKSVNNIERAKCDIHVVRLRDTGIWALPRRLVICRPLGQPTPAARVAYYEGFKEPEEEDEEHDVRWTNDQVVKIEDDMTLKVQGEIDLMLIRWYPSTH
jgi:hypothetical protein